MRNQQIGANPHYLPTNQQHQKVATHDQQNHRKSKQGNDSKKTIISGLSYHVT